MATPQDQTNWLRLIGIEVPRLHHEVPQKRSPRSIVHAAPCRHHRTLRNWLHYREVAFSGAYEIGCTREVALLYVRVNNETGLTVSSKHMSF